MDVIVISTAVKLSQCFGEGGCGWPIYINLAWIGTTSWPLVNTVPRFISAVDTIMLHSILQTTCTESFIIGVKVCMSCPAGIFPARKKMPLALLLALETDKYGASL